MGSIYQLVNRLCKGERTLVTPLADQASIAEGDILLDCNDPIVADRGIKNAPTAVIGGIETSLATRREIAEIMRNDVLRLRAGSLTKPRVITASNGYVIATYHRSPAFREMIDRADMVDADGMSLVIMSRLFLRSPLSERAATTDFIEDACRTAVEDNIRFYFLGAREGIAARAAERLRVRHPSLNVVGTRNGYFETEDIDAIVADIEASRAEVLWLGLGSPRQEEIAYVLQSRLKGVAWIRTCGGLFDHCSGQMPRAAKLIQNLGLEWLHRAALEPIRLGSRYAVTNPIALYHLLTKTHDV